MRLIIFVLCIAHNIVYASGSVHFEHFQDMLSSQTLYNSTLQKDKETIEKIHYKGEIHLSGVLEWQMYQDEVDMYWRLVFFPDVPNALPRAFEGDTQAIFLNDTLKKDIEFQKNSFLQIYGVLQDALNQTDEYILGGIAIRATLTLKNYYIEKNLESEADTRYYATAKMNSAQISKSIRKWHIDKNNIPSEYLLYPITKDPHINLRQSPNGKVLHAIQKDTTLSDCSLRGDGLQNKAILLSLGKDSANPKWFKVAYIPADSKDTSKAIYGVVHESQVSLACEE